MTQCVIEIIGLPLSMHADFVEEAIQELVAPSCVVQCSVYPAVCSPLSVVVYAYGKKQLVLDLRYVNQLILLTKLKYEGLNVVPQISQKEIISSLLI